MMYEGFGLGAVIVEKVPELRQKRKGAGEKKLDVKGQSIKTFLAGIFAKERGSPPAMVENHRGKGKSRRLSGTRGRATKG